MGLGNEVIARRVDGEGKADVGPGERPYESFRLGHVSYWSFLAMTKTWSLSFVGP